MTFLGLNGREHELGQQPFCTHSYLFSVNSISMLVPPESRNSPLYVQWYSEKASWVPSDHGFNSGNSLPLIQNTVFSVLLPVHKEACCLKVVELGRVFEFHGFPGSCALLGFPQGV